MMHFDARIGHYDARPGDIIRDDDGTFIVMLAELDDGDDCIADCTEEDAQKLSDAIKRVYSAGQNNVRTQFRELMCIPTKVELKL